MATVTPVQLVAALEPLVRHNRELARQNVDLAGRLGALEAQNEALQAKVDALTDQGSPAPSLWRWLRARVSAAGAMVL
jgi:hypothetical protein